MKQLKKLWNINFYLRDETGNLKYFPEEEIYTENILKILCYVISFQMTKERSEINEKKHVNKIGKTYHSNLQNI